MGKCFCHLSISGESYEVKDAKARQDIENVNNELSNKIENGLNNISRGTPIIVSSISEMTDTTRIYVNTSDGHWYYYNGSGWVDGGLYQSSGIADKSITYNNLESKLQNSLIPISDFTDNLCLKNKYVNENAIVSTISNFYLYDMNVLELETYQIDVALWKNSFESSSPIYLLMNNDTIVKKVLVKDIEVNSNNRYITTLNIPIGVNRVLLNSNGLDGIIKKVVRYSVNEISKNQLDSKLQSIFTEKYEIVEPTLFVDNTYFENDGVLKKLAGYSTYKQSVNPGEKYKITVRQIYQNGTVFFTTNNGEVSRTIDSVTYTHKAFVGNIKSSESEHNYEDYEFTIPWYCNEIYINVNTNDLLVLKKASSYQVKVEDIDITKVINQLNPLHNKILSFTGDSICAGNGNGFVSGWAKIIGENNPTALCHNYGVHGSTIAKRTGRTDSILERISSMDINSDYIIFQGGVNDAWVNIPLGEITSGYNGTYDETTFAGALESCFRTAQLRWKGKKIGYIVTQKQPGADNANFKSYMDLAKEICKKWSIPYIDLFNESCLNAYLDDINNEYYQIQEGQTTGDRCHPNEKGHQVIAPKIESWLKTL